VLLNTKNLLELSRFLFKFGLGRPILSTEGQDKMGMEISVVEVFSKRERCVLFIASVVGGPQDLVARCSEQDARDACRDYVTKHYERLDSGEWRAR